MIYTLSTESHWPGPRIGAQGLLGDTDGAWVNRRGTAEEESGVEEVGTRPVRVHGRVTRQVAKKEKEKRRGRQ